MHLKDSMNVEGLKVPVTLIPAPDNEHFCVRAGFRRTKAARELEWETIPAIIMPANTPETENYWVNILENTAREKLWTYEVARAAQIMRDRFGVRAKEFGLRSGYSEPHVTKLLACIDKLPPEIVERWKEKAPIPLSEYARWSSLMPHEAIAAMQSFICRNPKITGQWTLPENLQKKRPVRYVTEAGLSRTQKLRFAVEVDRKLSEEERRRLVQVVDFCTGAREDVPGTFDPKRKVRMYKSRREEDRAADPFSMLLPEDLEKLPEKEQLDVLLNAYKTEMARLAEVADPKKKG